LRSFTVFFPDFLLSGLSSFSRFRCSYTLSPLAHSACHFHLIVTKDFVSSCVTFSFPAQHISVASSPVSSSPALFTDSIKVRRYFIFLFSSFTFCYYRVVLLPSDFRSSSAPERAMPSLRPRHISALSLHVGFTSFARALFSDYRPARCTPGLRFSALFF